MKHSLTLCFFLSLLIHHSASAETDNAMFDLEGLTVKLGEEPAVNTKNWNLNYNAYSRRVINKPGKIVLDYKTTVFTDSKGRVEAIAARAEGTPEGEKVEHYKSFDGFYMNNLIIKPKFLITNVGNTVISKYLCDELDKDSFWLQMKKGGKLKTMLFDAYVRQFSNMDREKEFIKSKNEEIQNSNSSKSYKATFDLVESSLENGSSIFEEKIKPGSPWDHFIDENEALTFFQKECATLKSYSKDVEPEKVDIQAKKSSTIQK